MPTLAFFPWLDVPEDVTLAEFELLRYARGQSPFGPGSTEQSLSDEIFSHYKTHEERVVDEATILKFGDGDALDDLTENKIDLAFQLAGFLAFAGLSERDYFVDLGCYCNLETFQLVVQRFNDEIHGFALRSRRRDGFKNQYVSSDAYFVDRPFHAGSSVTEMKVDGKLLRSVLGARNSEIWPRLDEAIININMANTDRPDVSRHVEVVLTTSAFERALDCRGGDERTLASRFTSGFRPADDLMPSDCEILQADGIPESLLKCGSIREAWIRDLFRTRNDAAHGRTDIEYPAAWSIDDHLLLGAFSLPLLVKQILADGGFHTLTRDDKARIDAFEKLACHRHCVPAEIPPHEGSFPWNRILGEARLYLLMDEVDEES